MLAFGLGLVWFLIVAYGVFFYYTLFMGNTLSGLPAFIIDYALIFLAPLSAFVFVIYDRFVVVMREFTDRYLSRIIKN